MRHYKAKADRVEVIRKTRVTATEDLWLRKMAVAAHMTVAAFLRHLLIAEWGRRPEEFRRSPLKRRPTERNSST